MPRIDTVFLDRDGTVIVDKHYLCDPEGVELISGAIQGLRALVRAGMRLFLVSNQSGIGRGLFPEAACQACQERLAGLLAAEGLRFEAMRYCPHTPEAGCGCRKPATGMWEELRQTCGLDPRTAVMIGDLVIVVEDGDKDGIFGKLVIVKPGAGIQELPPDRPDWPVAQARDLPSACAWLLDYASRS